MKGNETIKFEAAEDIRENGSASYRTSSTAHRLINRFLLRVSALESPSFDREGQAIGAKQ
jgi:Mn-dependent DtxR family transcriptional regulator